jgi:hypothetical protein
MRRKEFVKMDYKQAIETIKSNFPTENYTTLREALDLAIKAMQKQIPTSPIKGNWSPSLCPTCGAELSEDLGDGYYNNLIFKKICDCGQKLNWD